MTTGTKMAISKHDWERAKYWDNWGRLLRLQEQMQAIWDRICRSADRAYDPFSGVSSFDYLDLIDYLEGRYDGAGVFDHIKPPKRSRMRNYWVSFKEREELEREIIMKMKNSRYKFRPR